MITSGGYFTYSFYRRLPGRDEIIVECRIKRWRQGKYEALTAVQYEGQANTKTLRQE